MRTGRTITRREIVVRRTLRVVRTDNHGVNVVTTGFKCFAYFGEFEADPLIVVFGPPRLLFQGGDDVQEAHVLIHG